MGESDIAGANGAELDNTGTLNLGTSNSNQLCAFEQQTGSATGLGNSGTVKVAANAGVFVGWQFANTTFGTVAIASGNGGLVLAGGEGANPEAGTWNGGYLELLSGSYSFPTPAGVNVSTVTVGTSSQFNPVQQANPLDALLGAASQPASLTAPAVQWSYITQLSGTVSIGDSSSPSSLPWLYALGGTFTLTSPTSQSSELQCSYTSGAGAVLTLYGATTVSHCREGLEVGPWGGPATINNEGILTIASSSAVYISSTAAFNQDGTLILAGGFDAGIVGHQLSGAPPPVLRGSGTTIVQDDADTNANAANGWYHDAPIAGFPPQLTWCPAFLSDITVQQQAIVNDSSACGLQLEGVTLTQGASITNPGLIIDPWPAVLHGEAGTKLTNSGTIDSNGGMFSAIPGAGQPKLVNTGSMIDDNPWQNLQYNQTAFAPNLVQWPVSGGGSIQSNAYNFNADASSQYGGSNPAAPYQSTPKCRDPVVCATGDQTEQQTDLSFGGLGGLSLVRSYNSQLAVSQPTPGMFGYGWTSSVEAHLWVDSTAGVAAVQQPNGSTAGFTINSDGSFTPDTGVEASLTANGDGSYSYLLPDQQKYAFDSAGELLSETSRVGLTTTLEYNSQRQLTSVTAPSGRQLTFTYNDKGLIATATDPAGLVVSYGYNYADDLTSVSESAGPATTRWQFGYDGNHELTSMTDGRGNTTTIAYQSGQVVTQTDPLGHTATWSYTPDQTLMTSPAGNVTQYLFNTQDEPVASTHGLGTSSQTTETRVYNDAGEPTAVTDGNGQTTTYTYDAAGNRTSETNAKDRTTSWTYDSQRDVLTQTLPSGLQHSYTYNEKGLPTQFVVSGSGGLSETVGYSYNDQAELTSQTDARGKTTTYTYDQYGDIASMTDPVGNETTYGYDADGRPTSSVAPAGNASGGDPLAHTTSLVYDALGDLTTRTDPLGHTTTYTYDPNRNRTSVTDANGQTTSYAYDADNELTTVTRPGSSSLTYGYDLDGNRTSQTDGAGNTTSYTYDPLDQLASTTDPLTRTTSYGYDLAGNLTSSTDPAGRTTTYGYDDANELTSISYSDGQTPNVSYAYNADGLRSSMSDGTGTTSYTHDPLDRLASETNGDGQTVSYGYDPADNVTSIGYPNGQTVNRTFDDDERLSSVSDWLGKTTSFAYNPDSTLNTTTFPSATSDVDTYGYDHSDQLTSIQIAKGTTTLASLNYTRDPAGMVSNETQTGLPSAGSTDYSYTSLNQLSTAGPNAYAYDAADNPTQLDGTTGYSYDAANQLTSSPAASYTYDGLGERASTTPTGGTATNYGYDQAGRLTLVTPPSGDPTSYAYDGDGLRGSKTTGSATSHFAWDQAASLPLVLTDGHSNYIYGPGDQPIEQIDSSGNPSYLHHDQLGSTRLITDQTGDTTATFTYNPYGALNASTGTATTLLGYAGQYTDPETGLQYNRARYYDPQAGQFLTRDPLEQITLQPYSYVNDNPLNGTDPTGLDCGITDPGGCINDVAGGLVSAGSTVAGVVASNAVPIAEGLGIVAACATPYVDIVTCPEAITGVAAVNIGINDVNEYNAAISGCPVGPYLKSDLFELATASLGLVVNGTLSIAGDALGALPKSTAVLGSAKGAVKYLNGVATGTGLGAVAAYTASDHASCRCQN